MLLRALCPGPQVLAAYKRLGGPQAVDAHTGALKTWLYDAAQKLKHSNGAPLLQLNSPPGNGATLNVNVLDPQARRLGPGSHGGGALPRVAAATGCGCRVPPGVLATPSRDCAPAPRVSAPALGLLH